MGSEQQHVNVTIQHLNMVDATVKDQLLDMKSVANLSCALVWISSLLFFCSFCFSSFFVNHKSTPSFSSTFSI